MFHPSPYQFWDQQNEWDEAHSAQVRIGDLSQIRLRQRLLPREPTGCWDIFQEALCLGRRQRHERKIECLREEVRQWRLKMIRQEEAQKLARERQEEVRRLERRGYGEKAQEAKLEQKKPQGQQKQAKLQRQERPRERRRKQQEQRDENLKGIVMEVWMEDMKACGISPPQSLQLSHMNKEKRNRRDYEEENKLMKESYERRIYAQRSQLVRLARDKEILAQKLTRRSRELEQMKKTIQELERRNMFKEQEERRAMATETLAYEEIMKHREMEEMKIRIQELERGITIEECEVQKLAVERENQLQEIMQNDRELELMRMIIQGNKITLWQEAQTEMEMQAQQEAQTQRKMHDFRHRNQEMERKFALQRQEDQKRKNDYINELESVTARIKELERKAGIPFQRETEKEAEWKRQTFNEELKREITWMQEIKTDGEMEKQLEKEMEQGLRNVEKDFEDRHRQVEQQTEEEKKAIDLQIKQYCDTQKMMEEKFREIERDFEEKKSQELKMLKQHLGEVEKQREREYQESLLQMEREFEKQHELILAQRRETLKNRETELERTEEDNWKLLSTQEGRQKSAPQMDRQLENQKYTGAQNADMLRRRETKWQNDLEKAIEQQQKMERAVFDSEEEQEDKWQGILTGMKMEKGRGLYQPEKATLVMGTEGDKDLEEETECKRQSKMEAASEDENSVSGGESTVSAGDTKEPKTGERKAKGKSRGKKLVGWLSKKVHEAGQKLRKL